MVTACSKCIVIYIAANATKDVSEVNNEVHQNEAKTGSDATPTEENPQTQEESRLLQEQEEKRTKLREERNEISRQV